MHLLICTDVHERQGSGESRTPSFSRTLLPLISIDTVLPEKFTGGKDKKQEQGFSNTISNNRGLVKVQELLV